MIVAFKRGEDGKPIRYRIVFDGVVINSPVRAAAVAGAVWSPHNDGKNHRAHVCGVYIQRNRIEVEAFVNADESNVDGCLEEARRYIGSLIADATRSAIRMDAAFAGIASSTDVAPPNSVSRHVTSSGRVSSTPFVDGKP